MKGYHTMPWVLVVSDCSQVAFRGKSSTVRRNSLQKKKKKGSDDSTVDENGKGGKASEDEIARVCKHETHISSSEPASFFIVKGAESSNGGT